MQLSVLERLVLMSVLPKEGDMTSIRIIRELREELSFSEEEHTNLQFREEDGMTVWQDGVAEKDIPFGLKALQITRDALQKLDSQKHLAEEHLSLWDKFMEEASVVGSAPK